MDSNSDVLPNYLNLVGLRLNLKVSYGYYIPDIPTSRVLTRPLDGRTFSQIYAIILGIRLGVFAQAVLGGLEE
jgi:hypothetical protein